MNIQVIGIDHIYIAVSNIRRSEGHYDKVMSILGFRKNKFVNDGDPHIQYYNRYFGFVLRPVHQTPPPTGHLMPGLHHLCFRVESIAELDAVAARFRAAGIECPDPEHLPEYAPDDYAIFFFPSRLRAFASSSTGVRWKMAHTKTQREFGLEALFLANRLPFR